VPQFDNHDDWLTVVGVVGNIKSFPSDDGSGPAVYVSYRQRPERALEGVTLVVSHAGAERAVIDAAREQMAVLDRDVPVVVSSLSAVMARMVAYRRFVMLVMTGFGAFALFLAALGVYGVLAYSVARRHREIGVRMALGAGRGHVLKLVASDGARAVVPGVAVGVVGAMLLARTMRSLLYGVEASDPFAFSLGLVALLVVATIAWVVPARRAARVDPMTAMRAE
jgi:putative ABC transport system permease protein